MRCDTWQSLSHCDDPAGAGQAALAVAASYAPNQARGSFWTARGHDGMKERSWEERMALLRARTATGRTSIAVSNLTKQRLDELTKLVPLIRSADELIYELAIAELGRRSGGSTKALAPTSAPDRAARAETSIDYAHPAYRPTRHLEVPDEGEEP